MMAVFQEDQDWHRWRYFRIWLHASLWYIKGKRDDGNSGHSYLPWEFGKTACISAYWVELASILTVTTNQWHSCCMNKTWQDSSSDTYDCISCFLQKNMEDTSFDCCTNFMPFQLGYGIQMLLSRIESSLLLWKCETKEGTKNWLVFSYLLLPPSTKNYVVVITSYTNKDLS